MNKEKISNCYNPGDDLRFYVPTKCKKCELKDYSHLCFYNTQGEYVCQPGWEAKKTEKDVEVGLNYIIGKKDN